SEDNKKRTNASGCDVDLRAWGWMIRRGLVLIFLVTTCTVHTASYEMARAQRLGGDVTATGTNTLRPPSSLTYISCGAAYRKVPSRACVSTSTLSLTLFMIRNGPAISTLT
ncbi:unnamed protein product, partial [Ectocarpus sp. 12 AP-2014]